MSEYRVNLENYDGPMDLLLYLIKRDEVDIHDISITRITEQYLEYVDLLQGIDPNLAGEFLVLASTLMEIKTRMLLPVEETAGEDGEEFAIDPRADLIRQLLQYKAFKDAAGDLSHLAEEQELRFPRQPGRVKFDDGDEVDLDDVQVWDLFDAFQKVLDAIGARNQFQTDIIYDDTPLYLHQEDILDQLQREGNLTFTQVFEGRTRRTEVVGLFIAMLELMRQQKVFVKQDQAEEIFIELNPNPPSDSDLASLDEKIDARFTAEALERDMAAEAAQTAAALKNNDDETLDDDDEFDDDEDEFDDDDDDDWDDADELDEEFQRVMNQNENPSPVAESAEVSEPTDESKTPSPAADPAAASDPIDEETDHDA